MPEIRPPRALAQLPNVSRSRHETHQPRAEEENWSDVAERSDDDLDPPPPPPSRRAENGSQRHSVRQHFRARPLDETRRPGDVSYDNSDYYSNQTSNPRGQAIPYANPFVPPTNPFEPTPSARPVDPPNLYPQNPNRSQPYTDNRYSANTYPMHDHSPYSFPQEHYYQANTYPPAAPPNPYVSHYATDLRQPEPPRHVEYELAKLRSAFDDLQEQQYQKEQERYRAERKEREEKEAAQRREKRRRDEKKLQRKVERKVEAELARKLQNTSIGDGETRSDPGRRQVEYYPREPSEPLALWRQPRDSWHSMPERRVIETDRLLLHEFAQFMEEKYRREDEERSYGGHPRDRFDQRVRGKLEGRRPGHLQSIADEQVREQVQDILLDLLRGTTDRESQQPDDMSESQPNPFEPRRRLRSNLETSLPSLALNDPVRAALQYVASHRDSGQYSPSESSSPERTRDRKPSPRYDKQDRRSDLSRSDVQEQQRSLGDRENSSPRSARGPASNFRDEPNDSPRGIRILPDAEHGIRITQRRAQGENPNTRPQHGKRQEPSSYGLDQVDDFSDASDDQPLYTHRPKSYRMDRQALDEALLPPRVPSPPPLISKKKPVKSSSEGERRRDVDPAEYSSKRDMSPSRGPFSGTGRIVRSK